MNICSINRYLQASCDLLRAALRNAVVAVFVQIVLYTGLLGHGDDAGFCLLYTSDAADEL